MRTALAGLMLLFSVSLSAQLKYTYNNEKLNIPDWLTNPNYASDNEDETTEISIEEKLLNTINGYAVVELWMTESEYNHGTTDIYLGTFNKKNNIIDITYVASHSTTDWNWTQEAGFTLEKPDIYSYFYVDVSYRPAESDEEQQETGGMVLSKQDTSIYYYKITKNGSILGADDIEMIENEAIDEEAEESDFDEEACILKIREAFNSINTNAASYTKKVVKEDAYVTTTYFHDNDELKKMAIKNQKTSGSEEFYFYEGELIFVFTFNKPSKEENRYYFHNQKMFRWLEGIAKFTVDPSSEKFSEKENEFLNRLSNDLKD